MEFRDRRYTTQSPHSHCGARCSIARSLECKKGGLVIQRYHEIEFALQDLPPELSSHVVLDKRQIVAQMLTRPKQSQDLAARPPLICSPRRTTHLPRSSCRCWRDRRNVYTNRRTWWSTNQESLKKKRILYVAFRLYFEFWCIIQLSLETGISLSFHDETVFFPMKRSAWKWSQRNYQTLAREIRKLLRTTDWALQLYEPTSPAGRWSRPQPVL